MKFSRVVSLLKYYWQFIPFRLNFILFLVILLTSFRWLKSYQTDTSSFSGLILLMTKIALIFSLFIVILSFLSSFISYLFFIVQKRKYPSTTIELKMDLESYQNNLLQIKTKLPFALKPLLGFVKVRLIYDQSKLTEKYILADRIKKQFFAFNTGLTGTNTLLLPDIKEYYFSNAMIYFEDMLQFFSFTSNTSVQQSITNFPTSLIQDVSETPPKKTEDELIRIEQLRKVEGELLNYKKFEDSDDVRRIVWKIFAKNKELVVRVPEIMDPFASHLYMYASFYNIQNIDLYPAFQQEMSNHFKNCVWTIYDALTKKEFEVRYISDQEISTTQHEQEPTQCKIAVSRWHQDKSLADYFKSKNGSVLCIHSFTSPAELKILLSNCESNTNVFFIQLSKVFKSYYLFNWLLRIFFKPNPDRLTSLRNKWAIHPLKFTTIANEKELISILKKSDINLELI